MYKEHEKITHVGCNHKGCTSTNAVVIIDKMPYCANHAYYKQTGRILYLETRMKGEKIMGWEELCQHSEKGDRERSKITLRGQR
tara:strand:- start:290 stop:541 length:252 start_codon:yes stop_codon:yes gene_type:complete